VHGPQKRAQLSSAALVAGVALLFAIPASAQVSPAKDALAAAERYWQDLDFELTLTSADKVLALSAAKKGDRLEALRLKGSALIVLERKEEAIAAFEKMFALDPEYELPQSTSPRILEVFRPARAAWQVKVEEKLATELGESYGALKLAVAAPRSAKGGRPLVVTVTLTDPGKIASQIVLGYRRHGQRFYSTLTARAQPGVIELTIPGSFTASSEPYLIELYVRARHSSGGALRRQGEPEAPIGVQMQPGKVPTRAPIYKKWWFWTGVAAVAVSSGLLIYNARDIGPQQITTVDP
jgi:tetratricopeptide (TPR) repeat protein